MKVDFVLPYVNCNEKIWQKSYIDERKKLNLSTEIDSARFREWDNLRFVFRGIEKNLPFINKIYLIVSNIEQVPSYIDQNKVKIVLHKDIIPKEFLPTFNSCTIEMFLNRIKGLSDYFIYSNDDIFLLKEFKESDFFDENGYPKIRTRFSSGNNTIFKKVQFLEQKKVAEIFNKKVNISNWMKVDHNLSPLTKESLQDINIILSKDVYNSCTKFRDKKNYNQYIYTYYSYFSGKYSDSNRKYKYFDFSKNQKEVLSDIVDTIVNKKTQSICINDSANLYDEEFEEIKNQINKAFLKIFPTVSKYEKSISLESTSNNKIIITQKTPEKIDYVFPYVDSDDPVWQKIHNKFSPKKIETTYDIWATDDSRFRSNDLLKYVFRGIEKNLPWINNVYMLVMCDSQVPSWLNKEKVKIITHDKFIPREFLPTFNSSTIEMFLGNIPGVSEKFLYGNDDMFPTRLMNKSSFFEGDKLKYHISTDRFRDDFIGDVLRREDRKLILNVDDGVVERVNHVITPYLKSTILEVYKKYYNQILNSCTMFRKENNYNQWIFSLYQAHYKNFEDSKLQYLVKEMLLSNIKKWNVNWRNYDVVCLNDSKETTQHELQIVKHKFEVMFPDKSKYER